MIVTVTATGLEASEAGTVPVKLPVTVPEAKGAPSAAVVNVPTIVPPAVAHAAEGVTELVIVKVFEVRVVGA